MRRTRYINLTILAASQILTFILIYSVTWELVRLFANPNRDVSWGLTVELAFWIFGALSLIGAVTGQFIFKERRLAVQGVSFLVFAAFFVGLTDHRPYRVSLLLFCALAGFLVPFLLMRKRLEYG
jgi:hypothetical protein